MVIEINNEKKFILLVLITQTAHHHLSLDGVTLHNIGTSSSAQQMLSIFYILTDF